MALQRLDFERRTIPDFEVNLETTPHVVRAVGQNAMGNYAATWKDEFDPEAMLSIC
jgi:hypothetical protein